MIKNNQQLARAEDEAERLREAHKDERLAPEQRTVVQAELEGTEREIAAFLDVRDGRRKRFEISDINDLADVLVLARIARGLTQEELADELGVRQQQVAKDENGGYHVASLTRISDVLDILDYDIVGRVQPADQTPVREVWFEEPEGTTPSPSAFQLVRSSGSVGGLAVGTQPGRGQGLPVQKKQRVNA